MPRLTRDRLTWLTYAQLGLFCYYLYGFGPIAAMLRDELHLSNAQHALYTTSMAVGSMAGGLVFPVLARKYGRPQVIWGCLAGIAVGAAGFVVLPATYPGTLVLSLFTMFCGIAVVNGVVVSLTSAHGAAGTAAISEANAIACFAGLVSPLVIGAAIGLGLGWRAGLAVLIGLIAIAATIARVLRIRGAQIGAPEAHREVGGPLGKAYWLAWWMLAMTGAIEVVLGLWSVIVLRERLGFSEAAASAAVAAILGGMMVGRAVGARVALRIRPLPFYFGALAVSAAGFAVFWTAGVPWIAVTGLLLTGLGNAMHYPLGISLALASAPGQPDRAAAVVSYSMGIGFGVGPLALGLLADGVGPHPALLLVPAFIVVAALLAWRISPRLGPRQVGDQPVGVAESAA